MAWLNVVLLLYGLLNIVMGYLGYAEKNSVISLIAGGAAGLIVLGSIVYSKYKPRTARITALVITILLMGRFGPKTFSENKLYPDGIEFVASLATFICLGVGHIMGMRSKRTREGSTSDVAPKV
ncbi:MAG: TMEM14 family protein [Fimbriimonas sp.]|nr:TMEM14 family protein [Fimbriimonas sp.]